MPGVRDAGANLFVSASAIFGTPDPVASYRTLADLAGGAETDDHDSWQTIRLGVAQIARQALDAGRSPVSASRDEAGEGLAGTGRGDQSLFDEVRPAEQPRPGPERVQDRRLAGPAYSRPAYQRALARGGPFKRIEFVKSEVIPGLDMIRELERSAAHV